MKDPNLSSKIRIKYREIVSAFIEDNEYLPEYRDYWDISKIDVIHLLNDANHYALFEVKSDFPEHNFHLSPGTLNPLTFWCGKLSLQYYKKRDNHLYRSVIKKKYKQLHKPQEEKKIL